MLAWVFLRLSIWHNGKPQEIEVRRKEVMETEERAQEEQETGTAALSVA